MSDLELVSDKELINELLSRCDHGAFICMKAGVKSEDNHGFRRHWIGNSHTVVGLLADLAAVVISELRENETYDD